MKTSVGWVFCCSILVLISACSPQTSALSASSTTDTNPPPRLTVELRDGSRVVGTSVKQSLQFNSKLLGDFKLEFKDIKSLEFVSTNSAKLATANGDSLMVSLPASSIAAKTGFGTVELAVNSIRNLTVSTVDVAQDCPDISGWWHSSGNNCTRKIEQSGGHISSNYSDSGNGYRDVIVGDWKDGRFEYQLTRVSDGRTTIMRGKIEIVTSRKIITDIRGTDGNCDLSSSFRERLTWEKLDGSNQ
jgi:hypothetical protein